MTYHASVVAQTINIEVTRAIAGENSRRSRMCKATSPTAITANDDRIAASTYAPVRPRAVPVACAAPATPLAQSTTATTRYAGAQAIAGPIGTTWCGRGG